MNRFFAAAVAGLLIGVTEAPAAPWTGACAISFQVTESMNRKFSGAGPAEAFTVEVETRGAVQAASWKMEVQPGKLSTQKAGRDEEMHKMFRLPEFSSATGEVKAFDLNALKKEEGATNTLPFALTILGVRQDLVAEVTHVKDEDGTLCFDANFTVDMKSFTLKPKVLLGLFKVGNAVPVRAAFTFTR